MKMGDGESQLDRLVNAVLASRKYENICEDFIRGVGSRELAKRRRLKDAIKATKNKLHQVGGAYLDRKMDYALWLSEIEKAYQSGNGDDYLQACAQIMSHHSSTKERLEILDQFYATILAELAPVHTVLDLACGLNPLSIPWMPLAENATYYAYDIYRDMIGFLNAFMEIASVRGGAQTRDVIQSCPTHRVDVAFILKTIPCLEQVYKHAGFRLLDALNAEYLLVSFPVSTLGGRKKGMAINYEARFREFVAEENWSIERFEFATELAFLVAK